ncbi:hypothetical protein BKA80DRAFT_127308 [Phyllosticta citrichinensis]
MGSWSRAPPVHAMPSCLSVSTPPLTKPIPPRRQSHLLPYHPSIHPSIHPYCHRSLSLPPSSHSTPLFSSLAADLTTYLRHPSAARRPSSTALPSATTIAITVIARHSYRTVTWRTSRRFDLNHRRPAPTPSTRRLYVPDSPTAFCRPCSPPTSALRVLRTLTSPSTLVDT